MKEAEPKAIHLKDYEPPTHRIETTDLTFDLESGTTTVTSRLKVVRASASTEDVPLVLDGQELKLVSVAIDGVELGSNEYQLNDDTLTLPDLPPTCEVQIVNQIHPEDNTALEGLYKSRTMYCTQCEAQGFRKITYYQDRPDVLSVFTTTIIADASEYPVLLSNGNLRSDELLDDGRRKVVWADPFPKPSYLFALVAGDLALLSDEFTTCSGRNVTLEIYSESHNIEQCHYAMDVLKRSMRWDEETFGREYDLDIFMIVAVEDFNMGAMENKGLNVFNTSCVLATRDTATDQAYQRVEAVVAHEYFHNWSGNRVTCRDWFQLSLKEGFTVFRDAEFSSDMNSRTVKRIEDVNRLRSVQFAEDSGPLAHPVRPDSYIEISNFYTPTVYEKGAEVVRMLQTIVGQDDFRRGSDLYFERHDGQAVTTDDFCNAMSAVTPRNLDQFQRWYEQAGTPQLTVDSTCTAEEGLIVNIAQACPATPGQTEKLPFHIPICIGLLDDAGNSLIGAETALQSDSDIEIRQDTLVLHLRSQATNLTVSGISGTPHVSFLRGFSAPVKVNYPRDSAELAFLALHDTDGFAAWDVLQTLLVREIERLQAASTVSPVVIDLFDALIRRALDCAELDTDSRNEQRFLLAAMLTIPDENYLFEQLSPVDVDGVCNARDSLRQTLATQLQTQWQSLYTTNTAGEPYSPDASGMSRRGLNNIALDYLSLALDGTALSEQLRSHYDDADNLTDRRAVLVATVNSKNLDPAFKDRLLAEFYDRWREEALVVNLWFSAQASARDCTAEKLSRLAEHPAFDLRNPNKVRAVYTAFANFNHRNFHAPDGSGYELMGDMVITMNNQNPQMAAALAKPLTRWRRYQGQRQQLLQKVLKRIAACEDLSTDVYEVVNKSLS
ncbi:MAG: aminopeptidase N [Gammaproteobacteria bacterium]|nr:aminopeptidase N [Gammaproteobacteria bacterium]